MNNYTKTLFTLLLLSLPLSLFAQEATIYTYRNVPQGQLNDLLDKETKYWSKIAKKAIDDGKLTFWAVLVRQGGYDIPDGHNVLYVNTFKDINDQEGVWDAQAVFPDVPMEDMETWTPKYGPMSHQFFVQAKGWQQAANNSGTDMNYIKMVYHSTSTPADFVDLEIKNWGPFIKAQMDAGNTKQVAWGNALLLSPTGPGIPFNSVSYDLYKSLGDALMPGSLEVPDDMWAPFDEIEAEPRTQFVYRIVTTASPDAE